jgi:TusA-related sulfurtransferase
MIHHYHQLVDAKGLKCPQPLLLAKQAFKRLGNQEVLLLEATDAHTDLDLQVWCERFGHDLIHSEEDSGICRFWLKKNTAIKNPE